MVFGWRGSQLRLHLDRIQKLVRTSDHVEFFQRHLFTECLLASEITTRSDCIIVEKKKKERKFVLYSDIVREEKVDT